ncbi:pimeloyl-[acyl-carrier protein] methyl ester esterase [Erwinia sp. OLTSP20]|uniref:pimeloyl-ACP methyl ester esterase BioH n=1 Tax=unclassified Erwinia TaxID=2622719 RepID=UPI000C194EB0|nr:MULTISPECIES: pimeloyl-ACP methyl ester esterase BioH [unclassified Erwinia]PIJ51188.1 pimeloyl-[acyl-carrier protein] methyl ester esterase [Erwinia sp. OAMSP11]PIJ73940.1 pimeloyl-[acyl-carrier protein] methyl ester esterase [Erwinia sp. OLSSP12]PIJ83948.1 pimeloyl-[acyl-carrier protein] methyl ester esterase [Erwinia sp. OLCASP19]PIJ86478.1 pimeloyl-[acyl-carrier protein] methyl ester esterase [Erwinia sp. OLMTSP26]PIJ87957.1 pimeloyl-[acyl-carrier protein] methyl ester esterase [Erwinia
MTSLYWQTTGQGNRDFVLLHGWGLNAGVWHDIVPRLSTQFRLHLVDLPGYGRSQGWGAMSLSQMAGMLLAHAPQQAVWLGWSLGGLVASQAALLAPARISALITVASSPRFAAGDDWPGIQPGTLADFQHQLSEDYQRTVERFLALQTLGTRNARQDARALKQIVPAQPAPPVAVLNGGLEILKHADLRDEMAQLQPPLLRIYGYLDGLVPVRIAQRLDACWPDSKQLIIRQAAHAPFISHPDAFCDGVIKFIAGC